MRWMVLGMGLVGCAEHREAAVWSDDGKRVASVRQQMECSSGLFGSSCSEVGAAKVFVGGDRLDVEVAPEWPPLSLYYLRTSNYLVYDPENTPLGDEGLPWVVVDAKTGDLLWEHRGLLLPSWDGTLVATLEREGEGLWVRLLVGRTGTLYREIYLDDAPPSGIERAWVSEDELRIGSGDVVFAVFTDGRVEPAEAPESWFPQTLSSEWNAERGLVLGDDTNFASN